MSGLCFHELHIPIVIGRAMKENTVSTKVLQKIGMTFKEHFDFNGHPGVIYELLNDQ